MCVFKLYINQNNLFKRLLIFKSKSSVTQILAISFDMQNRGNLLNNRLNLMTESIVCIILCLVSYLESPAAIIISRLERLYQTSFLF